MCLVFCFPSRWHRNLSVCISDQPLEKAKATKKVRPRAPTTARHGPLGPRLSAERGHLCLLLFCAAKFRSWRRLGQINAASVWPLSGRGGMSNEMAPSPEISWFCWICQMGPISGSARAMSGRKSEVRALNRVCQRDFQEEIGVFFMQNRMESWMFNGWISK